MFNNYCRILLFIPIFIFNINQSFAGKPLWSIRPAPNNNPTQTVYEGISTTIQYIVENNSSRAKTVALSPQPGISQTGSCQLMPRGQAGSSCTLTLSIDSSALPQDGIQGGPSICTANADGSANLSQCYQPASNYQLNLKRGEGLAQLEVNLSVLTIAENTVGIVTITNKLISTIAALNITAKIPSGSNISVQSTTCGSSLAIGASCTITLAAGALEGPTKISLSGLNTDIVDFHVSVTSKPSISITGPVQSTRVVPVQSLPALSLEITNDVGSVINAEGITVTDKASCPDLSVDSSNCTSLAPGNSCNLLITTNTPYVPCTITINGTNTANSPTTLIAFSYLDGLVFYKSSGVGKVVAMKSTEFSSKWTNVATYISNVSGTNGSSGDVNTDLIIADASCSGSPSNCAAQRCRNLGPEWYLPLRSELMSIASSLCRNSFLSLDPCTFGDFVYGLYGSYWSSRQYVNNTAQALYYRISRRQQFEGSKTSAAYVRCVQKFSY